MKVEQLASAVAAWLDACQPAMLDELRAWIAMESPTLDKERVDAFGRVLASAFAGAGAQVMTHSGGRWGDVVEAVFEPARPEAGPLLILGHLDTVFPVGTLQEMPFRIGPDANGEARVWGPGVMDMKGGLLQGLYAVKALSALGVPLRRRCTFLVIGDEEMGSHGGRALIEQKAREAEMVLVLEPGTGLQGKLKTARKGIGAFTLTTQGRATHAGVDFSKGASAVLELARQIVAVSGWTDLEKGVTVNAGVITGGTRSNVVAAAARADIDVRAPRLVDLEAIEARLRALQPVDARVRLEISGHISRPPMERTEAIGALFARARELGRHVGLHLEESFTGGGSDGNFTAALGIPTLDGLGMVGEGAHSPDESFLLKGLTPRTALIALLLARI